MSRITITAVVFRENGLWVAQCLEYNFVGCAENLDALPNELLRQIMAQVEADLEAGKPPFFGFKPAPKRYWDLFEEIKGSTKPIRPRKSLRQRLHGLRDTRVEAQLFPVVVAA
ncbi:MAG TPA: hypothetical protein VGG03_24645, partial [Thermoanaerobaculia bacterium]